MAKSATIPLVVCAFAVFSISVAVAQETRLTIAPDIMSIDKKLDAMPPEMSSEDAARRQARRLPGLDVAG